VRLAAYPNVAAKKTAPGRHTSVTVCRETRDRRAVASRLAVGVPALGGDDDVLDQHAQQDRDYLDPLD
jgi:hypothetical protein